MPVLLSYYKEHGRLWQVGPSDTEVQSHGITLPDLVSRNHSSVSSLGASYSLPSGVVVMVWWQWWCGVCVTELGTQQVGTGEGAGCVKTLPLLSGFVPGTVCAEHARSLAQFLFSLCFFVLVCHGH